MDHGVPESAQSYELRAGRALHILRRRQFLCYICRSTRYTMPAKSDLPQGTLDLLILKVVAFGPVHGYAIAQRLRQVSRDVVQVPQGSLYPALHRLENEGWIEAEWHTSEKGRQAKYYRLTRSGWKQLEVETANWDRVSEAIVRILQTA